MKSEVEKSLDTSITRKLGEWQKNRNKMQGRDAGKSGEKRKARERSQQPTGATPRKQVQAQLSVQLSYSW